MSFFILGKEGFSYRYANKLVSKIDRPENKLILTVTLSFARNLDYDFIFLFYFKTYSKPNYFNPQYQQKQFQINLSVPGMPTTSSET